MAIVWGSAHGHLQLGVEVTQSPSVVGESTSSVTLTARFYARATDGWGHYSNGDLEFSGGASGTAGFRVDIDRGSSKPVLVATKSKTVSTSFSSAQTVVFGARVTRFWNEARPAVSASYTVAKRPPQPPFTPSSGSVSYVSDSQASLSWGLQVDSAHPVTGVHVDQRVNNGDWVRVANLPASARAWSDPGITSNMVYEYRVFASNERSGSPRVLGQVLTRPNPPVSVSASRGEPGVIRVTWVKNSPVPASGFEIFDNGTKVDTVAGSVLAYDHRLPADSGAHSYTVKQTTSTGLTSAASTPSNTVNIAAPPNAPVLADSGGGVVAVGVKPVFAWRHNPADASAQTAYQYRWRRAGGSWTTSGITSAVGESVLEDAVSSYSVGSYEWQVRTWGQFKPRLEEGASPWSAVGVFQVSTPPTVGIVQPGDTVGFARVKPTWSYSQAEGIGIADAEIELLHAGNKVESRSVGAVTSVSLSTLLENQSQWVLRVRVKSALGLWSDWAEKPFTVAYPLPPAPTVTAQWVEDSGSVFLEINNNVSTNPDWASVPVGNRIYRQRADESWELLGENIDLNGSFLDRTCLTNGLNKYKLEAYTMLGAVASVEVEVNVASPRIWVNAGRGFELALSIQYRPECARSTGLVNRVVHYFAGRTKGVEYSGVQQARKISFSGLLASAREMEQWELASQMPGPFLYRDYHGARMYGSLSNVACTQFGAGWWTIQGEIVEVDYDE